jgi:NADPH-dependent 2,4-dienoyl-CoA reductase/sulfur reductase-like enzyme
VDRIVVVGASLAGVHAIERLRDLGFGGELTLVGAEPCLPYDRPPLSKAALKLGPEAEAGLLRRQEWFEERDVNLKLGQAATTLDIAERTVTVFGGDEISYDGLVISTGSSARPLGPTDETGPVYLLRTAADCAELHHRLIPGSHLVVIGAGFIGLEVAATAKSMGLKVSVVEVAPVPLARVLGDEVGAWFKDYHASHGIDIYCATAIDAIKPRHSGSDVHLRDGTILEADLVVAGVGAVPAVDWLRDSGLTLADGVVCNGYLRTSAPRIVAAGDVARWYNPLFDESLRVEQWTNAVEQGRYAAESLLGVADGAYSAAPFFWSDQFEAKMRFVGVATAAQDVHIEELEDGKMIALFGRDGVIRGALCINAPRKLALYRAAIIDKVRWEDVAPA